MSAHAAARADRLAARLGAQGFAAGRPGTVLIDGGAGSGKTTLARRTARRLGAALVHLDALYPGWDGLAAGAGAAADDVLGRGGYRRYDWDRGEPAEWVAVPRGELLVIEGCGAITRETLEAAQALGPVATVWVECPVAERRARALARDGEMFRPYWDRWAEQEAAHFAANRPLTLAREVVHTG